MHLRRRIERMERQTGVRATQWEEYTFREKSDEELFWWCHGCSPQDLKGKITRAVRQYTDNGFPVTITLETVE